MTNPALFCNIWISDISVRYTSNRFLTTKAGLILYEGVRLAIEVIFYTLELIKPAVSVIGYLLISN